MTLLEHAAVRCSLAGAWLPGVDEPVFPLGSGYSHTHQREMYDAVASGDSVAVLNTNPTGGGKTLSWAAPIIRSQEKTRPLVALATYPTRALIADQGELLMEYVRQYFTNDTWAPAWEITTSSDGTELLVNTKTGAEQPLADRVITVTGASPDDITSTASGFRAAEGAITRGSRDGLPTIVLTTPDALTLLASNRYRDSDLGAFPALVDRIIVDEFHLTSPRGKRLLPFHLDTYLTLGSTPLSQLVFLSATPTPAYTDRIERVFGADQVERTVTASPPDVGRQILPAVQFGVASKQLFQAGNWLADHVADLEAFVAPPGQTLIIVDSVREVEHLAAVLSSATDYDVGRIYGWKKQARAQTIAESDIVVGNTAVEVGIDFDRVNRLVFTAHDHSSALQRLGRMRVSEAFDDYRALCLTTTSVQDAIYRHTRDSDGPLTRTTLEQILADETSSPGARLPYDAICAAYTQFLWAHAEQPLTEEYVPQQAREPFQQLVHDHFGTELAQLYGQSLDVDGLWSELEGSPYHEQPGILEELHTYRSSSLGCLVIDPTDDTEPLKEYNLQHVLRYRNGRILPADDLASVFEAAIGRSLTANEQSFIESVRNRVECGFLVTGRRDAARDLAVRHRHWHPDAPSFRTLSNLRVSVQPAIEGLEHLDPLETDVLAHYVPESPRVARDRYDAGAYANLLPYRSGSVFLWQDAILTHAVHLDRQRG